MKSLLLLSEDDKCRPLAARKIGVYLYVRAPSILYNFKSKTIMSGYSSKNTSALHVPDPSYTIKRSSMVFVWFVFVFFFGWLRAIALSKMPYFCLEVRYFIHIFYMHFIYKIPKRLKEMNRKLEILALCQYQFNDDSL